MNQFVEAVPQLGAIRVKRLGEILVERQIISAADLVKALAFQEQFGGRIGGVLVRLGALSEETLLPVLAEQLDIPLLRGRNGRLTPSPSEAA